MTHYRSLETIPTPKSFLAPASLKKTLLGLVALGVITFLIGLWADSHRAWSSYLLNYFYWMSLGLAGVFFTALQHVTGSVWSAPIRRVAEVFGAFLPVSLVLFLFLFFGLHDLYEWTHADVVAADPLLQGKAPYLNFPFFAFRNILFLVAWTAAAYFLLRNSCTQDDTGAVSLTKRSVKISAIFILFFAVSYTLTGFDLMMSLEPHWFSTIFGIYCFAGLFLSGLAMITVVVILLKRQGYLPIVNDNHLFDLGKLMFAFCVFWAYIAFSQFMLIWYSNLPEETFYMIRRVEGPWKYVSILLLLSKFIIPFLLLLPATLKRKEGYLLKVAIWILVAHWIDCYWMVYPVYSPKMPVFGWMEVGVTAGFAGLFGLSLCWLLKQVPVYPKKDPKLLEGVNFHQP